MTLLQRDLQERYVYIGLPAEYQEVEYIESSGTQYINTGLAIKDGYKIICKANFTTNYNGYQLLGGYLGQSGNIQYRLYGGINNIKLVYGFLGNNSDNAGSVSLNTDYILELSMVSGDLYFKVNGTTIASSSATYSTSLGGDICVLAGYRQDYSGYYEKRYAKVYSYEVYNNTGFLVRDMIPCYRKSDNVIGMYDLVNDVFYTNSGTGTFAKGNDTAGLKNVTEVYIGNGDSTARRIRPAWKPGANTVAYYPLDSTNTVNDMKGSGTAYNLSNNGGVTFGTNAGVSCASFPGNNNYRLGTSISTLPQSNSARTFSFWFYDVSGSRFNENLWFWCGTGSTNNMVSGGQSNGTCGRWLSQYGNLLYSNSGDEYNKWIYCTITYNGSKFSVYKNNNLLFERTYSINTSGQTFRIGGGATWTGTHYFKGYISEFIIENKVRTDQERSDYYNLTKGDYGL